MLGLAAAGEPTLLSVIPHPCSSEYSPRNSLAPQTRLKLTVTPACCVYPSSREYMLFVSLKKKLHHAGLHRETLSRRKKRGQEGGGEEEMETRQEGDKRT